jgi:hypothetical protein
LVSLNLEALGIVRPETVVRWHRLGFRAYWRWRSRSRVGRPKASTQLRTLIRQISRANPLWVHFASAASRSTGLRRRPVHRGQVHADVGHYRRDGRPSFAITRLTLARSTCLSCRPLVRLLYGLAIITLRRRHLGSTSPPIRLDRRQITEAFPWEGAPIPYPRQRRLLRTCRNATSCCHGLPGPTNGGAVSLAERTRGEADRLSPERMPGPRCDHGRTAPAPVMAAYANYYNGVRTHRSLAKDAPLYRIVEGLSTVASRPVLGGLYHQYCRI